MKTEQEIHQAYTALATRAGDAHFSLSAARRAVADLEAQIAKMEAERAALNVQLAEARKAAAAKPVAPATTSDTAPAAN